LHCERRIFAESKLNKVLPKSNNNSTARPRRRSSKVALIYGGSGVGCAYGVGSVTTYKEVAGGNGQVGNTEVVRDSWVKGYAADRVGGVSRTHRIQAIAAMREQAEGQMMAQAGNSQWADSRRAEYSRRRANRG